MLIANPLRLKGLEEEGKVDLSKVRGADMDMRQLAVREAAGGSCSPSARHAWVVLLPTPLCTLTSSLAVLGLLLQVSFMVLDEADKLLAMGFAEQVDALLAAASNPHIKRALFSATLPDKVC